MQMGIRIIDILAGAYRSVEENWCTWLKVMIAPLFLSFICQFIGGLGGEGMAGGVLAILGMLAGFLFSSILMVNLYRYGIMGDYKDSWINLRFDRPVWMVVVYSLLLLLLAGIAVGVVTAIHLTFEHMTITGGVGALVALLVIYLYFRLVLLIPAVAVCKEKPLRSSFAMTGGHVIFIFFALLTLVTTYVTVFVVTAVPFAIAAGVLSISFLVSDALGTVLIGAVGFVYFLVCYLYIVALSAKLVSNIYVGCEKK